MKYEYSVLSFINKIKTMGVINLVQNYWSSYQQKVDNSKLGMTYQFVQSGQFKFQPDRNFQKSGTTNNTS